MADSGGTQAKTACTVTLLFFTILLFSYTVPARECSNSITCDNAQKGPNHGKYQGVHTSSRVSIHQIDTCSPWTLQKGPCSYITQLSLQQQTPANKQFLRRRTLLSRISLDSASWQPINILRPDACQHATASSSASKARCQHEA